MKTGILPITISLLIISITGCSLIPGGTKPTPPPIPSIPPSGYEPQPGDEKLKRDQVFLDLANCNWGATPAIPTSEVQIILQGNLPDPCHSLRVVVTPPDANNVINLDAYSVVDPAVACITVLKPFAATIPLGDYPDGEYTVMVNGERFGLFSNGSGSAPATEVFP